MGLKLIFFTVILTLAIESRSQSIEDPLPETIAILKGFYSVLSSGTAGYYAHWEYKDVDIARDGLGIYLLNQKSPFAFGPRFAFTRHTRRDRLAWGLSYFRYASVLRIDSVYSTLRGNTPLVFFDGHKMHDIGNVFSVFFEPRLVDRTRFSLHAHAAVGLIRFGLDDITIPVNGGPIAIASRRFDNAGFEDLYAAYGLAGRYRLNPFYSIYGSVRQNMSPSLSWSTETVDVTLGIELNLRRGGVSVK